MSELKKNSPGREKYQYASNDLKYKMNTYWVLEVTSLPPLLFTSMLLSVASCFLVAAVGDIDTSDADGECFNSKESTTPVSVSLALFEPETEPEEAAAEALAETRSPVSLPAEASAGALIPVVFEPPTLDGLEDESPAPFFK